MNRHQFNWKGLGYIDSVRFQAPYYLVHSAIAAMLRGDALIEAVSLDTKTPGSTNIVGFYEPGKAAAADHLPRIWQKSHW